jgi:nonsense-mediated mRNA decay protein 3
MTLCLSQVSGLKSTKNSGAKIRLVDASWIWTEPHSMRLKCRLTIQREVVSGTILQQSFSVVFIVRNQQCLECQAEFRQGSWKSVVQVRQRVTHKRTFLYLEQLILKHGAHRGCLSIETFSDGMDFYFPEKNKAARFMSFLEDVCPTKKSASKKLIGTDDKSNVANYKYTNLVEICPLCKDDLLYLPARVARKMGNISRLVIVKNVSSVIHLLDPRTGQTAEMSDDVFWREPFWPLITAARSRMTRYMVLGKEPVFLRKNVSRKSSSKKQRSRLALLTMAREDDLGKNDSQVEEQSHCGYLLKAGDVCLAYDLKETQFVDDEAESLRAAGKLPDVIVVRKLYGGVATGEANAAKQRIWKLQRLDVEVNEDGKTARGAKNAAEADEMDQEDFMQEVEADKDMRQNMNLYQNEYIKKKAEEEQDDEEDEDDQQVALDELLDGLALKSGPDLEAEPKAEPMAAEDIQFFAEGEKAAKDGIKYVSREDARNIRDKETAVHISGELAKEFDDL